jgi:hypothetical protein
MKTAFRLVCLIVCMAGSVMAQELNLTPGAFYIQPAWSLNKGAFYLGSHARSFFKDEVISQNGTERGETFWNVQGRLGLHYGLTSKFELGVSQIIYQDTHRGTDGYNLPDDLLFRAKLARLGVSSSNVRYGLQLDVRLPTGQYHNVPLEPYSSDRITVGLTGLFSILSEPLYPQAGVNIHANLGFKTHNDVGARLTEQSSDTILVSESTTEVIYGAAFSAPIRDFTVSAELYGRSFVDRPPITAFSREASLYLTSSLGYQANPWLYLKVGLDLRLLGGKDQTVYDPERGSPVAVPWKEELNYPAWRLQLGTAIAFHSGKIGKKLSSQSRQGREVSEEEREQLYDEFSSERIETESAEEELERIRRERQRMQDLLDRLRTLMEKPAGSSQPPAEESQEPETETPE